MLRLDAEVLLHHRCVCAGVVDCGQVSRALRMFGG
jgi:hypothetical protein